MVFYLFLANFLGSGFSIASIALFNTSTVFFLTSSAAFSKTGVSVEQVRDFFKSFPYKTIIDTDDMDLTDVYHFCTLDYAATPMIKNIYNTEVVSVNEMKESLEVVFDFAKKLDDGKLSPLEKLMFLYDYLKTRIYKEDKNYSNSTSLSRVTLGESIVCLGYSNLFSAIANLIGISTYVKTYINMLINMMVMLLWSVI